MFGDAFGFQISLEFVGLFLLLMIVLMSLDYIFEKQI